MGMVILVALSIGLTFLFFQCVFMLIFGVEMRRHRRIYERLKKPGEDRTKFERIPWIAWINERFPPVLPRKKASGSWDRSDALAELERLLGGHWAYHILQRQAILAPVCGVLITALGFLVADPPTSAELSLSQILGAIKPLFSGIVAGGALSGSNQIALFFSANSAERVRFAACSWFDNAIWPQHPKDANTAMAGAARQVASLGKVLEQAVEDWANTSKNMEQAASKLLVSAQAMTGEVGKLTHEIQSTKGVVDNIRTSTVELENSSKSVNALLSTSMPGLIQASTTLNDNCTNLTAAVKNHESAASTLKQSVEKDLTPVQQRWSQTAKDIDTSLKSLIEFTQKGIIPATEPLSKLADLLARLQEIAKLMNEVIVKRDALEPVVVSVQDAKAVTDRFEKLPEDIRKSLTDVSTSMKNFPRQVLTQQLEDLERLMEGAIKHMASCVHAELNGKKKK